MKCFVLFMNESHSYITLRETLPSFPVDISVKFSINSGESLKISRNRQSLFKFKQKNNKKKIFLYS